MPTTTLSPAGRLVVVGTLAAATVLAGLATVALMGGVQPGMPADAAEPAGLRSGALAMGVGMWAAMMAAMMLPSTAPTTVVFAGLCRRRLEPPAVARQSALFVVGYLAVWAGFSVAAASAQQLLAASGLLAGGALGSGLAGVVLAGAGVYQLTPAKHACLRRCRSPVGFLLANWRDGATASAVMGVRHGLWCAGCCVGLMTVMFAVGVMSLVWMGVLALVVLAEKTLPLGAAAARLAGVGLIALGLWTLAPLLGG